VLRHVRHDERLADLPVIMISSRTGAKHQDRARELGVNHFLGKPFQEAQLLDVIEQFMK
jgi:chemosensory pili system protein ChpA (sensor histidine kinase/response regulator)